MNDPFAAIRARFVERTREDLAVIEAGDPTAVRDVVHRLAGTAGTLGFDQLSALAAAADEALQAGRTADLAALKTALAAMHG